jgi:hypothetical protein
VKSVIEFKGVPLPSRQFVKDPRVSQGAIADNKILGPLLAQIRAQQKERDAQTLATKRLTLRDEDLMRKGMGPNRSSDTPQAGGVAVGGSFPTAQHFGRRS